GRRAGRRPERARPGPPGTGSSCRIHPRVVVPCPDGRVYPPQVGEDTDKLRGVNGKGAAWKQAAPSGKPLAGSPPYLAVALKFLEVAPAFNSTVSPLAPLRKPAFGCQAITRTLAAGTFLIS